MEKIIFILILLIPVVIFADEYQVGDHELFFMSTAYTMPVNKSYFSSYELFLMNYTFAPTSSTHAGVFTLFPIIKEFMETFTLGIKQNYIRKKSIQSALFAVYNPKIQLYSLGNVFSVGKPSNSFHFSFAYVEIEDNKDGELLLMCGYRKDIGDRTSFIVEYSNSNSGIDVSFTGLVTLGFRFRATKIAWEIAGARPLESTGNFLLFPFLKATYYFK